MSEVQGYLAHEKQPAHLGPPCEAVQGYLHGNFGVCSMLIGLPHSESVIQRILQRVSTGVPRS